MTDQHENTDASTKEVAQQLLNKLDDLDEQRQQLQHQLETKRYQLNKVESVIEKLEDLQQIAQ
jgi:prefoldin subunit 5